MLYRRERLVQTVVRGNRLRRELRDGAVIRHDAVHLDLDVGRLCVDGGRQPVSRVQAQLLDQIAVCGVQIVERREAAVSPVAAREPGVPLEWKAKTAELAEDGGAIRFD